MRRRSFTKSLLLIAVLSLGATSVPFGISPVASEGTSEWKPAPHPEIYDPNAGPNAKKSRESFPEVCSTETQVDCFESVYAFIKNEWVKGIHTPNTQEFQIPGLENEDGRDLVEFHNEINYTGNVFHQVNVYASTRVDSRRPWESGETDCGNPTDGVCYREGHLESGVKFKVTYRSSWVLPTVMSAKLSETKTTVEKLPQSGATRVTVEGIPQYFMGVNNEASLRDPNGRGSWGIQNFAISMTDGRFYPIKKECIEKETLTVAENSYGHPLPAFENNELSLRASAPHYRPDGTTKHTGFYNAVVPMETARCLWGEDISNASQFSIEVFETSTGEAKTATTSVKVEDDALKIDVIGFSYSEPTIRVKYQKSPAPAPAPAPAPEVATAPVVTAAPATAPVAAPVVSRAAKPKGVKLSLKKGAISTTFTRVAGTTYTAVATTKGSRKALKCRAAKTKVTCATKGLKKGQWKLTITPSVKKVKGTSYVKTVRIK